MLIDTSYIRTAVSRAVEYLEMAGSESQFDALVDLRDECERKIAIEKRLREAKLLCKISRGDNDEIQMIVEGPDGRITTNYTKSPSSGPTEEDWEMLRIRYHRAFVLPEPANATH
jgi:hypothetical protein